MFNKDMTKFLSALTVAFCISSQCFAYTYNTSDDIPMYGSDQTPVSYYQTLNVGHFGECAVFLGVKNTQFYIAPKLQFVRFDDGKYTQHFKIGNITYINMKLKINDNFDQNFKHILRTKLPTTNYNSYGLISNVNILTIGHMTILPEYRSMRMDAGITSIELNKLPKHKSFLTLGFEIKNPELAEQIIGLIERKQLTFKASLDYESVSVQSGFDSIEFKTNFLNSLNRNLDMGGAYFVKSDDVSKGIQQSRQQIIRETYHNKNLNQSLNSGIDDRIDKLIDLFSFKTLNQLNYAEKRDHIARFLEEMKLDIRPSDFKPMEYQQDILYILNSENNIEAEKQKILEYLNTDQTISSYAKSAGGILGLFNAGGSKNKTTAHNEIDLRTEMEGDKFKEFLEKKFAIKYTEPMAKARGIEIIATQDIKHALDTSIKDKIYSFELKFDVLDDTIDYL